MAEALASENTGQVDPGRFFAPEGGFVPEDFPQLTVAPIPYTSNPMVRPDPHISILPDGWLYIEVGNVRIALPDREEWDKLVSMGERLWNTHQRDVSNKKAYRK